jgi:hypothetical protein
LIFFCYFRQSGLSRPLLITVFASGTEWDGGAFMKTALLASVSLAVLTVCGPARAGDISPVGAVPYTSAYPTPYPKDWDKQIGNDFWTRLINYYALEMGHDEPLPDPSAPPGRRKGWTPAPATIPPYPFTEWPYGGATAIGVTRPNSVDSPLMAALSNTSVGKAMNDAHIQIYGWVNVGGNVSTNTVKPGGNWPASYMYTPDTVQLDQAVVYIERLPDTVQTDHVDWGFRLSAIYGENYRYTTSYGVASYQLLNHNLVNGYDFPMMYGEMYIPWVAEGLLLRFGRFISLPDIEAQLAPNNYMYSHSIAYTFDNYTNTGLQATLALTKNWFVQLGATVGTEAPLWHWGQSTPNPFPNVVPRHHHADGPGGETIDHRLRALPDRYRLRQHLSLRRCHQQRYLGLQQPAVAWRDVVPQVQREVSGFVRILPGEPEERAQHQRSRGDHRQQWLSLCSGNHPVQCAQLRAMQQSLRDHLYHALAGRLSLLELPAHVVR